jgi:hypothetical protein
MVLVSAYAVRTGVSTCGPAGDIFKTAQLHNAIRAVSLEHIQTILKRQEEAGKIACSQGYTLVGREG